MPNWAEGVLKIRGTKDDVRRFLIEALKPNMGYVQEIAMMKGEKVEQPNVEIKEDQWDFNMKSENGFHIEGARRAFIEQNIQWYFKEYEEEDIEKEEVLSIDSFKQAWGVDVEVYAELSRKYNIDFKIYVFERGMEFNQDIEIHKGVLVKNNTIEFDDYTWECLMPNLGG